MLTLDKTRLDSLTEAASLLLQSDVVPILELKDLLHENDAVSKRKFRSLFTRFYQMKQAHLDQGFVDKYFALLEHAKRRKPFPTAIDVINKLPRNSQKKGEAIQYSFASKFAATLDEANPIWDKHVRTFFGLRNPSGEDRELKLKEFSEMLAHVKSSYDHWATTPEVNDLTKLVRTMDAHLIQVSDNRLLDVLVWKVGNENLL